MLLYGTDTKKAWNTTTVLARAGEAALYLVENDSSILIKVFDRPLTPRAIKKLTLLAAWLNKPPFAALPIECVQDAASGQIVGFRQKYFSRTVPLTCVLDTNGRTTLRLPDDLAFRVKLCRLLAEAFARVHAANLVIGDVSDGNFLLGRDWFGRASVFYAIDCNSFQVTLRTNRGNEFFPSGVATEEYAAPEVQPTDWATSLRSVYSDSFGFAVLAWKMLFNGSHPFAVVTPRSVDVPPLGERIEKRLFPFYPGSPLPANWKAPSIQPSLAVLPVEVREMFFRTFSSDDPRDRPTGDEWCRAFRSWELVLTPSLPFRVIGAWNGSIADRLAGTLSTFKPYLGRAFVFAALVVLTVMTTRREFVSPTSHVGSEKRPDRILSDSPRTKSNRPRPVDRELFPEPIWNPSLPSKE